MINIYVDESASMNELGKKDSVEVVLKSLVESFEELKIPCKIQNFKIIDFSLINDNTILISDGLIQAQEIKKGISIAIGIDADIDNLKQISKKVFEVDEITKIEDHILHNIDIEIQEDDEDEW